ncbi:MAG: PadR family transcriptional regulator [Faecalibacterium sp.]|jgi:PadR family transcriptional regulator PadR|nr:PadR family transcriptional regulator [Faecalibacterium sp.]
MEKENNTANAKSGTPAGMKDAMKKATTEMLVLFLLRQKNMYVYEMIQEAARITKGVLTFNTLYLAIYRLKERGYIQEDEKRIMENRTRVYFAITESGQAYLQALLQEYRQTTQAIDSLLQQDGKLYGGSACTKEN